MLKKILILLLTFFTTSCLGLFTDPDSYYSLKTRLRKIADFKIGSYWIYHCDSLNINDTISVVSYEKKRTKEHYDSHYQYRDNVLITLKSTYWNCIIKDVLEPMSDYRNNFERSYSENKIVGTMGYTIDFYGDSEIATQFGNIEYLSTYNFNGVLLDQVIYHYTKGRHLSDCEYYFAPDYGLIKMRLVTDSISTEWNLVEYNIVK